VVGNRGNRGNKRGQAFAHPALALGRLARRAAARARSGPVPLGEKQVLETRLSSGVWGSVLSRIEGGRLLLAARHGPDDDPAPERRQARP